MFPLTHEQKYILKGKPRTQGLFLELSYTDTSNVIFTLKYQDHVHHGNTYLSLPKLFLSMVPDDPTEYDFAQAIFGEWDFWKLLSDSPKVKPYVEKWRREVDVILMSKGIKGIIEEAAEGGRSKFTAAKWLADKGWRAETPQERKRKARDEEDREIETRAFDSVEEDLKRLGMHKVN